MKLTKDYILKHIRETKYPLWSLFVIQNYRRIPIMHYSGDDFGTEEKIEQKTEKSIMRLSSVLSDFPKDAVLSIDLKKGSTANGSGILGPIEFINIEKEEQASQEPQPQIGGLGFASVPAGYVSELTLNGKLEELRAENTRQINEILFKHKEKEFNEKMERERAEIEQLKRELKDEQKKYESNTGAAAETLVFAVKKLIKELFPNFGVMQQAQAQPQLQGTTESEPAQMDARTKAVSDLADYIYDNNNFSEKDIINIKEQLQKAEREAASDA